MIADPPVKATNAAERSRIDRAVTGLGAVEMAESPPALRCRGLCKQFGREPVVNGVDLQANQGEFVALLGRSGCGKTTTLRVIAGLDAPDGGTVEIDGVLVAGHGVAVPPERRRVGMVFQDGALFPHLTVQGNVEFGLPRGSERRRRVTDALDRVGMTGYAARLPYELSGGQQQRVALARALAPAPSLILLDEPFSNLDAGMRSAIRTEVREILADAKVTAVLVTHDQEEALSLADRVAVMQEGRIVQQGSPEELYHRPVSRDVGLFVGDAQFLPGEASGRRVVCELGELPVHGTMHGEVDVMIRPESVRLSRPDESLPGNATIVGRLFFGHDQLMRVKLDSGCTVNGRIGSYGGIRPGDRVHASVRGAVLTFPRAASG